MSYSSFGGRSGCRDDPRGDFVRRRDETRGDFARRRDEPRGDGGENEPETPATARTGDRPRRSAHAGFRKTGVRATVPHQSHARHEEPDLDINSKVGDEHLALGPPGGIIDPTTVSKLDNKDLSPKHNVKLLEEHISHLNQKMLMKTSTLYCCRQCGRKKTAERSAQMRSLDEGETLIITCTWCSYKWFV
ncbi:hypothetical protein PF001_g9654 [Phytophthora fragariae]|uniref:TFIIS-type domain-containing protein n=1 Tax=Phytophthora fragariae TaxID=53985 RepID=A0A6A3E950_9STRA|nr:hypothetical protein PF009_g21074 [Phytophthora fragariae]KAE9118785.1 hypothetical protein PF006_g18502 [Phytophthora fragariae]KAE9311574.1 hypothetical protein PF001_g9654 [Phytophthora fragariae]